jgi:hypothetical protein
MKKLKEISFRVGDIILTTSPEKISKTIRKGTKSDISHAMIYEQAYYVIDAPGTAYTRRTLSASTTTTTLPSMSIACGAA